MRLSKGKVGLGPNSLGILRYMLPYNGDFHIAARFHDISYRRGGNEHDRRVADDMFFKLMIAVSTNCISNFFAIKYHYFVRKFGMKYFKYKR